MTVKNSKSVAINKLKVKSKKALLTFASLAAGACPGGGVLEWPLHGRRVEEARAWSFDAGSATRVRVNSRQVQYK